MTVSDGDLGKALRNIKDCMDSPPEGAAILGAHMEGPYIALSRRGGQKAEYVKKPDWQMFRHFFESSAGIIKLVDIAPECDESGAFIENAARLCRVSIAHTNAGYEQTKEAFTRGASHVTHLFNAMPGFGHREPGAVGAVFENRTVTAELICDGFHVHPAVLRVAFDILGEDRPVIVSDAMRAAGLPDGVYSHGGQKVTVAGGEARLADGTIAGSTTNLLDELRRLVSFGVPLRQAVRAATINPARVVGADKTRGSITPGKRADFTIVDQALRLRAVVLGGVLVRRTS
jgi:N-acetylglucosamine-6-phosphate deacetylase